MPTAAPPPRLEREQSRQRSLGRALTVQPLQICACWLRTAELLPYSSSSSSSLPLFPVTPSSPTELSLALPYDRRVGAAVEGVSVLCSECLGNGRKKKTVSERRSCATAVTVVLSSRKEGILLRLLRRSARSARALPPLEHAANPLPPGNPPPGATGLHVTTTKPLAPEIF